MTPPISRPLRSIIVDDEPLARELIKSYIDKTPSLSLEGCFESAAEAVKSIVEGTVDLVFLDINMPLLNGIEFGRLVPERTKIVYITAYESYALDGFRVNALDYLLKPVSYAEFMKAVGKAVEWFSMAESVEALAPAVPERQSVFVRADSRLVRIKVDSILYIEVRKDRLIFVRKGGGTVTTLMTMREVEELLPASIFMRVHRSFIVNLMNIEEVERNRIVFGKEYIPVADSRREEFFARLSSL